MPTGGKIYHNSETHQKRCAQMSDEQMKEIQANDWARKKLPQLPNMLAVVHPSMDKTRDSEI